jgi:hypothetical protein
MHNAVPRGAFPVPIGARQPGPPPTVAPRAPQINNGPRDTITVKELMINVIERSLSGPGTGGHPTAGTSSSAATLAQQDLRATQNPAGGPPYNNPTIQTLLEHSDPAGKRQGIPGALGPPKVTMAPPPAPSSSAGDCETLDLSLPRKRDSSPPTAGSSHSQYREPASSFHHLRGNPNAVKQEYHAPPPAHLGSKKTPNPDPYFRGDPRQITTSPVVYGADGRPLSSQSPHSLQRSTAQSPSLARPGSGGGAPVRTVANMQYGSRPPPTGGITSGAPLRAAPVSPRSSGAVPMAGRPLGGSITQGTPVNQAGGRYESLVRMSPADKVGSITHGTPVYDKKHPQLVGLDHAVRTHDGRIVADYYRGRSTTSPAGAYAYPPSSSAPAAQGRAPSSSYPNDQHSSSRQVIINDYEMARSREMQRRPESREPPPRSASPRMASGRDPSPRPRAIDQRILGGDPRAQLEQLEVRRDGRLIETRYDARGLPAVGLPDHRGDPKADLRALDHRAELRVIHDHRSSLEARGDPRAGLDPRMDSRVRLDPRGDLRVAGVDPRADLRVTHDRREEVARVVDPRAALDHRGLRLVPGTSGSFYPGASQAAAHVFMANDGKYNAAARPRSPPRGAPPSTTPPQRASAVIHRPPPGAGGITSGKPILNKAPVASHREVEIYRSNPEVTISKTSSPRHNYGDANALSSLVDVAVQQKKLHEGSAAVLQQQAAAAAAAAAHGVAMRPGYDARQQQLYNLEKSRYATTQAAAAAAAMAAVGHLPTSTSASLMAAAVAAVTSTTAGTSSSTHQLVEQVRSERAKQQQLYMMQQSGKEKAPAFSSAVHLPAKDDSGRRAELAAENASRTLTAANLIDAIITHSINSGTPAEGAAAAAAAVAMQQKSQYRRSPTEATTVASQEDKNKVRSTTTGPREPNGPEEGSSSRPCSRSSSVAAAIEQGEDADWRRRASSAGAMPAPRPTPVSLAPGASSAADERQITKVAQPTSPGRRPRESPVGEASADLKKQAESGSPQQSGPGLARLSDYVKNKIVEEMKKGEDGPSTGDSPPKSPSSSSATAAPAQVGSKRPSEGSSAPHSNASPANDIGHADSAKKRRLEAEPTTAPSSSGAHEASASVGGPMAPDSPGSEGEMVIDETVRPDSVGQDGGKPDAPPSKGPSTSTDLTLASGPAPPKKPVTQPTYEPLSDDE